MAEFDRVFALRDPLGGGKLYSRCLLYKHLKLRYRVEHVLVMLRRVLDRVFGNVRSGETKLVNAVSFVVRDVERVGSACINLVRVLAHRHIKPRRGLARDHGGTSVGADNVSVVLEVR